MNNINIRELADRTREAQQAKGLALHTVWEHYITTLIPIVKLHEQENKEQFDRDIVDKYIQHVEGRRYHCVCEGNPYYYNRSLQHTHRNNMKNEIETKYSYIR